MSGKRWLAMAIALVAILTAACDYPDYRGSPAHTGFNAFENSISAANVPTMTVVQRTRFWNTEIHMSSPTASSTSRR